MIMESHGAKYFLPNYCDFYIVGSLASRYFGFAVPKGDSNLATNIAEIWPNTVRGHSITT